MRYHIIPVTALQQNCTLLCCPHTGEAAIVDPGGDADAIQARVTQEQVTPVSIWLTHGHWDHVGAAQPLAEYYNIPILGPHEADRFWLAAMPMQAQMFSCEPIPTFYPQRWLQDGDILRVGEETLAVIHCPGHTPGHVVFYHAASRLALVGDVLFHGSIGRADFPKSDLRALLNSIQMRLWPLGRDVQFIPGHGPMSTFGLEMDTNPYVAIG